MERGEPVGGMAVIEGVMMRQGRRYAVAVRDTDGTITVQEGSTPAWAARWAGVPLVRGVVSLAESLGIGVRALAWSASRQQAPAGAKVRPERSVGGTVALALLLVVSLFFVFPATVARAVANGHGSLAFTGVEATIRIGLFLAYLWGIGHIPEVRRLFGYHGAEHAAVSAHEAGVPLSAEAASAFGTRHVRCGTTFMLVVMVLAVAAHAVVGDASWAMLIASRVLALPLVAGIAYEILRAAGAAGPGPLRWLLAPGLALQALTTRPPDHGQLEVAVVALRAALAERTPLALEAPAVVPATTRP